jgi:Arc/MetJ family transcription regulator
MKTTLNLDDALAARLKREAVRRGSTMSELVEAALRLLFRERRETKELPELPSFDGGGTLVDVADRSALYEAMEGR